MASKQSRKKNLAAVVLAVAVFDTASMASNALASIFQPLRCGCATKSAESAKSSLLAWYFRVEFIVVRIPWRLFRLWKELVGLGDPQRRGGK